MNMDMNKDSTLIELCETDLIDIHGGEVGRVAEAMRNYYREMFGDSYFDALNGDLVTSWEAADTYDSTEGTNDCES